MANIGLYDTLVQIKAVELMPPKMDFLYKLLVKDNGVVSEEEMVWDYMKGTAKAAPFVSPRVGGVVMERDGFRTDRIRFSNIVPKRVIEGEMLEKRGFGEALLGDKVQEERAKRMLAMDLAAMKESIQIRRGAMVADLFTSGKMLINEFVENGVIRPAAYQVDYNFTNRMTLTKPWSDDASDPNADMEALEDMVTQGLGVPQMILMRSRTANALINNKKFREQLDNRRMQLGSIAPSYTKEPGLKYLGNNARGIELYAYDGHFEDDKFDEASGQVIGTQRRYMLKEGELYSCSSGIFSEYHGPITQIDQDGDDFRTYRNKEVPKVFKDAKTDAISQQLRSRPMYVPFNVDAWGIMDGLL